MCEKCVRRIKHAKLSLGKIKFYAHYVNTHKYACIPLFLDNDSNRAIEGYLYLLQLKATDKSKYSRKGRLLKW